MSRHLACTINDHGDGTGSCIDHDVWIDTFTGKRLCVCLRAPIDLCKCRDGAKSRHPSRLPAKDVA